MKHELFTYEIYSSILKKKIFGANWSVWKLNDGFQSYTAQTLLCLQAQWGSSLEYQDESEVSEISDILSFMYF